MYLRVSPTRGIQRFRIKGKLALDILDPLKLSKLVDL
jgi:hypothetical protein